MWPAVDHPLVLGLAHVHQIDLAWEEFERNSLQWQASVQPKIWAGLWTSGDQITQKGLPGLISYAYPALCMHRHAWPQVSLVQLAGLHFESFGLAIRPAIPPRLGAYNVSTGVASVAFNGNGLWSGRFSPPGARHGEELRIEVDLSRVSDMSPVRTLRARSVGSPHW